MPLDTHFPKPLPQPTLADRLRGWQYSIRELFRTLPVIACAYRDGYRALAQHQGFSAARIQRLFDKGLGLQPSHYAFLGRNYVSLGHVHLSGIEECLDRVSVIRDSGASATIDLLGEDYLRTHAMSSEEQSSLVDRIEESVATYRALVNLLAPPAGISADPFLSRKYDLLSHDKRMAMRPTLSIKPSMACIADQDKDGNVSIRDAERKRCYDNLERIVSHADQHGVSVTIDMEDRKWTEFTVDTYLALARKYKRGIGVALQTRMLRTPEHLAILLNELKDEARVRLCIGTYPENDVTIAMPPHDTRRMKERMLELAEKILEAGAYVEFATHDKEYLMRFFSMVGCKGINSGQYEIQALEGVLPLRYAKRLIRKGHRFRYYEPFALDAEDAVSYCDRRAKEVAGTQRFWRNVRTAWGSLRHSARAYSLNRAIARSVTHG